MAAPTNAQNVKKALAYTEPSTHGTFRTSRNVRPESAMRIKADIADAYSRSAPTLLAQNSDWSVEARSGAGCE